MINHTALKHHYIYIVIKIHFCDTSDADIDNEVFTNF